MKDKKLVTYDCRECATRIIPRVQVAPMKKIIWAYCPICSARREMKVRVQEIAPSYTLA